MSIQFFIFNFMLEPFRRHMLKFFEHRAEITLGIKATFQGYIQEGEIGFFNKFFRFFYSKLINVVG